MEDTPLAGALRLAPEVAAVRPGELAADEETQARPLNAGSVPGAVVPLEESFLRLGGMPIP
jgi:hypothetical protein